MIVLNRWAELHESRWVPRHSSYKVPEPNNPAMHSQNPTADVNISPPGIKMQTVTIRQLDVFGGALSVSGIQRGAWSAAIQRHSSSSVADKLMSREAVPTNSCIHLINALES